MTATAPPRPHTPRPRPEAPAPVWTSSVLAPVAAGLATLFASTSLTGVVSGWAWFGYLLVAVVLIASTGLALRSLRAPTIVVGLAQLLVLLFLITGAFTTSGILKVIPGPDALEELRGVLAAAAEQIRVGLPPVEGTPPILCLVTIAIGLVAVLVDTLAVAAAAPAATGLVLLCVYAVPAALAEDMLPWWTFLLGAAAFAALLAVDGNHRHRRWRNREAPGLGNSASTLSAPVGVVAAAIAMGLVIGTAVTGIGTVGKLPGAEGTGRGGAGGFGVEPFTQLRGLLDQGENVELFKVYGMGADKRLLRAFTLDTYTPNKGWGLAQNGRAQQGVQANKGLPPAPGDDGAGPARDIRIEPTNWVDNWLPIYGAPRSINGLADNWLYDPVGGAVFTTTKQNAPAYTETASIKEPSKDQLRLDDARLAEVPQQFVQVDRVDPRVAAKAKQLTENESNNFDKAQAIWSFFTAQNGFVYDTKTADATDSDALADFILNGKRGFCEQYASAMAVMLRSVGIPSRVAIGFTSGTPKGDYLSISSEDAHAWVEVYFQTKGWVSFDPTPLLDGRAVVPPYLQTDTSSSATNDTQEVPSAPAPSAPATGTPRDPGADLGADGDGDQEKEEPLWPAILAGILGGLAAALTVVAIVRSRLRHRALMRPGASSAADREDNGFLDNQNVTNWLPLIAIGLWVAAFAFLAAWVSWWFALALVVVLGVLGTPTTIREIKRRLRLQKIASHSPAAADAAWRELMDECADRGLPLSDGDTVRVAGRKVVEKHRLDEEGRTGLRTVIGVVEKSWYSDLPSDDQELGPAFDEVRKSLKRNAPMSWKGRLFPRSLRRGKK
ncbi:transglutaminaseTgpA domain-containing protein [Amycolatopsis sp. NPDC052450]|uniref:transglutaminase family protein n=1 Tax=Amycolatopsis sp. NPDC052450 TaxID=3363937 RepID=UPI0037C6A618